MKKINYLLMFLLLGLFLPLTGQSLNVNDPANKESLSQLKKVREMIMRSDNPVFKTKALKQTNEQMEELLFGQKSVAEKKFTLVNKKTTNLKNNQKFFDDHRVLQNGLRSSGLAARKSTKAPVSGVMKYRLDSLIFYGKYGTEWVPEDKQEFTYNYNAMVTSNNMYLYDTTLMVWQGDEKTTITYNEAGDVTLYYYQWWNGELQRWIDENEYIIEYNANGEVSKEEMYSEGFDVDSLRFIKRGDFKHEYFFDSNNNEIGNIYYVWSGETGDWIPDSKNEYFYEDGFELMFAAYRWDNETQKWIGHWKFEHQLVPGFELLGSIYYNWSEEQNNWVINSKTAYEVSSENGVTVTETNWNVDYESGNLVLETKSVYTNQQVNSHNLYSSFKNIVDYKWNPVNESWEYDSKRENTFDSFGNITQQYDSIWKNLGEGYMWIPELEIISNVNTKGLVSDYIMTTWYYDGISNLITAKNLYQYTYDENNNLVLEIAQTWDFTNQKWNNTTKVEYTYSNSGKVTGEIWYNGYNEDTMEWIKSRKVELDYNVDGTSALYADYEWNIVNQSWKLTYKTENRIDAYGETVLEQSIQWNSYLKQEVINYKREKIYDEQRNLLSETYINTELYWDGDQYQVSTDGEKTENTYSAAGQLLTNITYYYSNGQFIGDEKYEYVYNTTYPEAVETEYVYSWNESTLTWNKEGKGVLTSNFEVSRDNMILPFGDEGESREVEMYFSYMATELVQYEWSGEVSDWVEESKVKVYFSQSEFSSVDDVDADHVTVYPNPVSDFISVRLNENTAANIRLYDLQGRKIYESPVNNQSKIDLSNLANGVYFYQIIRGQETVTGKLLKK
ncbi:hypothetical protein SDC9_76059 [bioreactor metagenome]|uniref:Secretion system C-terminal sorting domain-containing protein n=1 Tax=bioreactor metagenome TaxID=1076179 RepID=A0A644YMI2_9ZZZZ|nr:T9SS type A sorting domain-containing protein [Paludibacter sp.]